ncbi:SRPBCC family protein [Hymenobacter psoromatis]|uniref:SRPBCC family protein n=1 Tax=Hymenobacter psoromatis TaxID=1484116 RepID=UPI001CBC88C2|nr:SRPBCC family protein [Hymenobacter psoromatis]
MNKRLLTYGGVLLGAAAGTVLLLEKNRRRTPTSQLNPAAPVRSRHTVRMEAPAARAWQVLSQVNQWPAWQPEIAYAHLPGPVQNGAQFDWSASGYLPIHSTLHTVEPSVSFGWSGAAFGSFAVHNWQFVSHEGYTEVTAEETMEGWLVRLLRPIMQPALDRANARWLARLKQAAEQGS